MELLDRVSMAARGESESRREGNWTLGKGKQRRGYQRWERKKPGQITEEKLVALLKPLGMGEMCERSLFVGEKRMNEK